MDDEQWWFLLVAGCLGGLVQAYNTKKDLLGYIISCIVGAFSSLFFASSLALWTHNYFNLTMNISEYLSGCGFIIGLTVITITDFILKKLNKYLEKKLEDK